jgi:uncharacterized ferredoxin-like protein
MKRDVTEIKNETIKFQAASIMNRMLTAPKAKGEDDIRILYVDGDEKKALTAEMRKMAGETGRHGYIRDAANIDASAGVILLGARKIVLNLNCGICGAPDCAESLKKDLNCVFPLIDIGIALGSGVSACMDQGLDNRIMYSVGIPCLRLGYFNDASMRCVIGVPLSAGSKNIFFDRK